MIVLQDELLMLLQKEAAKATDFEVLKAVCKKADKLNLTPLAYREFSRIALARSMVLRDRDSRSAHAEAYAQKFEMEI